MTFEKCGLQMLIFFPLSRGNIFGTHKSQKTMKNRSYPQK